MNGDKASELAGSMVDQEGDVLDEEGNIIGHADSVAESLKDVDPKPEEEGSQKPLEEGAEAVEKPEIKGPFGVQDQGEITNASGVVIGKLAEGTPQDLVGTSIQDIDAEGNLVNKSGSIVGKAELNPTLPGKEASQAGSQLPEGVEGSKAPEGVEGSKVPGSEAAEGVEGELPEGEKPEGELPEGEVPEAEVPDLSILKDKTVNKLGKIVDAEGNPFGVLVEGEAKELAG